MHLSVLLVGCVQEFVIQARVLVEGRGPCERALSRARAARVAAPCGPGQGLRPGRDLREPTGVTGSAGELHVSAEKDRLRGSLRF